MKKNNNRKRIGEKNPLKNGIFCKESWKFVYLLDVRNKIVVNDLFLRLSL
jgi:hypothetical protein